MASGDVCLDFVGIADEEVPRLGFVFEVLMRAVDGRNVELFHEGI
jgi:hypothetical protein